MSDPPVNEAQYRTVQEHVSKIQAKCPASPRHQTRQRVPEGTVADLKALRAYPATVPALPNMQYPVSCWQYVLRCSVVLFSAALFIIPDVC